MPDESEPTNENLMKNSHRDPPTLKDANPQAKIHPDADHPNLKMLVKRVSPPLS